MMLFRKLTQRLKKTTRRKHSSSLLKVNQYVRRAISTRTQYVTDIEGHLGYLKKQVRNSDIIKFSDKTEREIAFKDEQGDDRFVFGGDACDRGEDIQAVSMLTKFKKSYPERVTLIAGNRDLNKVRFWSELPSNPTEKMPTLTPKIPLHLKSYQAHLEETLKTKNVKTLQQANTGLNYLRWMLTHTMNMPGSFENRRKELAFLNEKSISQISDIEVYNSFYNSVQENGFMREYIKQTQLAAIIGDRIFVHGGITEHNMGKIPKGYKTNELAFYEDPRTWVTKLNIWFQGAIEIWDNAKPPQNPCQFSTPSPAQYLRDIGTGNIGPYYTMAQKGDKRFRFASSVIYTNMFYGKNCPQPVPNKVADYLLQAGIKGIIAGHQPHGATPVYVTGKSIEVVTGDTLYGNKDAYHPTLGEKICSTDPRGLSVSYIYIVYDKDKRSTLLIKGLDGNGISYTLNTAKNTDPHIGKIIHDENGVEYLVRMNTRSENFYMLTNVEGAYTIQYNLIHKSKITGNSNFIHSSSLLPLYPKKASPLKNTKRFQSNQY